MGNLDGVALITGAGSGIGRQTAFTFAEAGARGICFADVSKQNAEKALEECKAYATKPEYQALAIEVDVTDEAAVQEMVEVSVEKFGRVDYGVNSAGNEVSGTSSAPIQHLKVDNFDKILAVNLKGTMLCVKAVSNQMAQQEPRTHKVEGPRGQKASRSLGRGVIVNLGSVSSHVAAPGMTAYTASKHGVIGLTKCAALDLMPLGIRVNVVCSSWVKTPMVKQAIEQRPMLRKIVEKTTSEGRMALPEEVAETIVFLCSPGGTYVNGASWIVDGGTTISARLS